MPQLEQAKKIAGKRRAAAAKPKPKPPAKSTLDEPSATGNPTVTIQAQELVMQGVGFQIDRKNNRYVPPQEFIDIIQGPDMDPAAERVCVRALMESLRNKGSSFERNIKLLDEAEEFKLTEQSNEFVHQYYQVIKKQILRGLSTSGIVAEAFLPPSEPLQKLENIVKEKREEKAEAKRKQARREGKGRVVD